MKDHTHPEGTPPSEINHLRQELQHLQAQNHQLAGTCRLLGQKFQLLFDSCENAIAFFLLNSDDTPGPFIQVNRAALNQWRCSEAEVQQLTPLDITAPEVRPEFLQKLRELRTGGEVRFETEQVARDGTRFTVEIFARQTLWDGHFLVLAIGRDVSWEQQAQARLNSYSAHLEAEVKARTAELVAANRRLEQEVMERRQAEEALKTSQEYARNIIECSLDMIIAVNLDRHIIEFNRAAQETFGYTRDEAIGAHVSMLYADQDEADYVYRVATEQGRCVQEVLNRRKNGEVFPSYLSASVLYDAAGNKIGVMGISRDITARRQAQMALEQRNRELAMLNRISQSLISSSLDLPDLLATILEETRNLLDIVACSIWLVDPLTGELVCREATEPQREVVVGWRLAPGQGLAGWVVQTGQSLNIPDVQDEPRHFQGVDQKTGLKLRSILTVPLVTKQKVVGVIQAVDEAANRFTANDLRLMEAVAANAAAAIENARLYEEVRQSAAAKAMLLKEVNHRVKNNLAAIVGLLYAERKHAAVKENREFQALIQDLIGRVQGMAVVHDMLSAAEWSPILLSELVSQVAHTSLQLLPGGRHIQVNITPSDITVPPRQATPLALIINELVTNSAKYAFHEHQRGRIDIRFSRQGQMVRLEFRDDGAGYPESVLRDRQFNVGLYLLHLIVQQDLEGSLSLRNDGGAVATLEFRYLPAT